MGVDSQIQAISLLSMKGWFGLIPRSRGVCIQKLFLNLKRLLLSAKRDPTFPATAGKNQDDIFC